VKQDTIPTTTTPAAGGQDGVASPRRRRRTIVALAAIAGIGLALGTIVLVRDDGDDATTTAAPTTQPAPSTASTASPSATTVEPTTTEPVQPSAADTLAPFFAAAETMDQQLRDAAAAINGAGPPWDTVSEELASAVRAADIGAVTATIPAGLPHELLEAVMLPYSELSSRRAAMQSFSYTRSPNEPHEDDLLAELANGHEAAQRFDGDLAAARALAASLPPVTPAAYDSRETAELLVILDMVHKSNFGCDSRGGGIFTDIPTVTWTSDTGGYVGSVEFTATLGPGGQWEAYVIAC
jgi:hypothetical protein